MRRFHPYATCSYACYSNCYTHHPPYFYSSWRLTNSCANECSTIVEQAYFATNDK